MNHFAIGLVEPFLDQAIMISSETKLPASMTPFACLPISVPAAMAPRSISPVESCAIPL